MTAPELNLDTVTLERDGHVLVIGLNRPDKRNAFNLAMIADLSRAYALLESDETLRAGVLFAHGDHFTAGPRPGRCRPEHRQRRAAVSRRRAGSVAAGRDLDQARRRRGARPVPDAWHRVAAGRRHPGSGRRHPVLADGGAARDLSVRRRHHPAAAPDRMGQCDAVAAHRRRIRRRRRPLRIGLVQEVAADAAAAQAKARRSRTPSPNVPRRWVFRRCWRRRTWPRAEGDDAAIERLRPEMTALFGTADAAEGVQSFIERREARFQGR